MMVAASVPNVYALEGGVNGWLSTFADTDFRSQYALTSAAPDGFGYILPSALGPRYPAADPNPDGFELAFTPVVELQVKRGPSSGDCG
jgi:hypothetical protein